jgi:hypothetical protein
MALPQHHRRSARPRRRRRNVRAFLFTTVIAAVVVVAGARYLIGQFTPQTDALALSLASIQHSKQALQLEHQREHIILMTAATKNFKVVGKPRIAAIAAAAPAASSAPIVPTQIPSPGTAQAIAYRLLPAFGFSHNQFGCLNNIWSRESGWRVTAANASGAYGIPQALPGSKMASAGPNWQTNATTQVKWGLGYIKGRYSNPCGAWAFWQNNGWY